MQGSDSVAEGCLRADVIVELACGGQQSSTSTWAGGHGKFSERGGYRELVDLHQEDRSTLALGGCILHM